MKLAVCLRGHMRQFPASAESIANLRLGNDVDVYIHTYDSLGWKDNPNAWKRPSRGTLAQESDKVDVEAISSAFSQRKLVVENYDVADDMFSEIAEKHFYNWMPRDSVFPNTVLSQMYKFAQSVHLFDDEDTHYDWVIVTRPDVSFTFDPNQANIPEDSVCVNGFIGSMYNHPDGGVWWDDVVVVGSQESVRKIASSYDNIPSFMKSLEEKNLLGIAKCMHQIQSYIILNSEIKMIHSDCLRAYIVRSAHDRL